MVAWEDNGQEEEEEEIEMRTWTKTETVAKKEVKEQPDLDKDSISHSDQEKRSNLLTHKPPVKLCSSDICLQMDKKQVKMTTTTGVISNSSEKMEVELKWETKEVISDIVIMIPRMIELLKFKKLLTLEI
jgi:hypothetical protein